MFDGSDDLFFFACIVLIPIGGVLGYRALRSGSLAAPAGKPLGAGRLSALVLSLSFFALAGAYLAWRLWAAPR